ncbi:hypothetical protein CAEBREN_12963 [Caenorhabditis brenneri]|uniref:Uncharacterized protein n=1 Tax=Caenorhabditis brenneri TaxID=135651 RepID=G0NP11_CAEBE|nr:hypothetical protein CAEBREN_12963 [Caenorhabditis brenneri]
MFPFGILLFRLFSDSSPFFARDLSASLSSHRASSSFSDKCKKKQYQRISRERKRPMKPILSSTSSYPPSLQATV